MDRYPELRTAIKQNFGSIYQFIRESEVAKSTVEHLILGNLNEAAERNAQAKIQEALTRLRPDADLSEIWIRQEPQEKNNLVMEIPSGAKRLRINLGKVDVTFE